MLILGGIIHSQTHWGYAKNIKTMIDTLLHKKIIYKRLEKEMEELIKKNNKVPLNNLKPNYGANMKSLIRRHYYLQQIRMREKLERELEEAKEFSQFNT